MPIRSKEIVICGTNYKISQHGAEEGWGLFLKISKIGLEAGDILSELPAGNLSDVLSANIDLSIITKGLNRIVNGIIQEGSEQLVLSLLKNTERNGKRIDRYVFDEEFAGNFGELLVLLYEVIVYNFDGALKLMSQGKEKSAVPLG